MAGNWSKGSGSSTMLILKLLTEKDMYGYEMIPWENGLITCLT